MGSHDQPEQNQPDTLGPLTVDRWLGACGPGVENGGATSTGIQDVTEKNGPIRPPWGTNPTSVRGFSGVSLCGPPSLSN